MNGEWTASFCNRHLLTIATLEVLHMLLPRFLKGLFFLPYLFNVSPNETVYNVIKLKFIKLFLNPCKSFTNLEFPLIYIYMRVCICIFCKIVLRILKIQLFAPTIHLERSRQLHPSKSPSYTSTRPTRMIFPICICNFTINPK